MPTAETGTGATNDGTLDPLPYVDIGGLNQTLGFGLGCRSMGTIDLGNCKTKF